MALADLQKYQQTTVKFLGDQLKIFAKLDMNLKKDLYNQGWTEENCNDCKVFELWDKFKPLKTKVFVATGARHFKEVNFQSKCSTLIRQNEVIDLMEPNLKCTLFYDTSLPRQAAYGALLDGKPVICSGRGSKPHKEYNNGYVFGLGINISHDN